MDWVAYKPPLPQYRWRLSSVAQFVFPQKDDAVIPKDINHVHMAQNSFSSSQSSGYALFSIIALSTLSLSMLHRSTRTSINV